MLKETFKKKQKQKRNQKQTQTKTTDMMKEYFLWTTDDKILKDSKIEFVQQCVCWLLMAWTSVHFVGLKTVWTARPKDSW